MALTIATNTGALMAAASATSVNKDMETSMERLSTGKRINSAADDAVGLAISTRMDSQVRAMNMQVRNASDGISLIQSAEGAMQETTNILQRMYELSVQASNSTFSDTDRTAIQAEVTQLQAEIDRIAGDTQFNGQNILDGNFLSKTLNVGFTSLGSIGVSISDQSSSELSGAGTTDALASLMSSVSNIALGADTQTAVASTTTAAVAKVDSQTLAINQTQFNIGQNDTQSLTSSTAVENVSAGSVAETFTTKDVGTAALTAQVNTITIGTGIGEGHVITITGVADADVVVTLDATTGVDENSASAAVATAINAATGSSVTAEAASTGGTLTLTANVGGTTFSATSTVATGGSVAVANTTANATSIAQVDTITLSGAFAEGDVLTLGGDDTATYTVLAADLTGTDAANRITIAAALVGALGTTTNTIAAVGDGTITVTAGTPGTAPTTTTISVATDTSATAALVNTTAATVTQGHGGTATVAGGGTTATGTITIGGTGFAVGASFGFTDGTNVSTYTISAEDIKATDVLTREAIATSFSAQINAGNELAAKGAATVSGAIITLAAGTGVLATNAATTTAAASGIETITLGGDFATGDQITIYGRDEAQRETSFTYTVTEDDASGATAAARIAAVTVSLDAEFDTAAATNKFVGVPTTANDGVSGITFTGSVNGDFDLRVEIIAKDGRQAMEAAGTTDVNIAYVDAAAGADGLDEVVDVRSYTIGGAVKDGDTISIQASGTDGSGTGATAVSYTVDSDDLVTDAAQSKSNAIDSFVSLFNNSDLGSRYDQAGGLLTASREGDDTIVFTAETASATSITFNADLTVTDRAAASVTITPETVTAATAGAAATADVVMTLGDNLKEGDVLSLAVTGALGDAVTYTVTRDDIGADADATIENVRDQLVAAINAASASSVTDSDAGVITAAADGDDIGTITLTATSTVAGSTFAFTLSETDHDPDADGTALTSTEATLATVTAGTATGPYEDDNGVATVSTQVVNMTSTTAEIEVGDVVELTVGDTTVSHTVVTGKATAEDVIAALAEKVNNPDGVGSSISTTAAGVITASADDGVLTLSSTNTGAASTFSVSTNTVNKAATTQASSVEFDAANALETGDKVRLSLSTQNYVEVEVTQDMVDLGTAGARLAVRDALVALSDNLENATLSADADDVDKINVTGTTAGVAFTATMTETQATAVKQQDLLTISGQIGRGDIFTADVGGFSASVTVTDEIAALRTNDERITAVRDALVTKMNETAAVTAVLTNIAASGTDGISITALTAGSAIDSTDSTTTNNTSIASQLQIDNVTLSGDAEEGDVFAIDLGDGNAVSYTVTSDDAAGATAADRLNAARDGLVAAAASLAGVVVTSGDDASVVLTAALAGTGFETSVTTTNAADVAQVEAVAFGNVEAGDTFTVSIGDESFSYTAQEGDDGAAVASQMQSSAAFTGKTLSVVDGALNITGAAGESFAAATASSNFAGGVQVDSLTVSGTVETGDVYSVTIDGAEISYSVADTDTAISDVSAGLVAAINSSTAGETLTASLNDDGSISLTGQTAGVGFTAVASVSDVGRSRDTIATVDVTSEDGAISAQAVIQSAIELVSATRAELGAIENRLTHTIDNLTNVTVNTEASKGRILDADFAAESTALSKAQILQQASTAMLAQANASKQSVLSLLQG